MPTTSHLAVTRLNVNNARCFAPSGGQGPAPGLRILPTCGRSRPRPDSRGLADLGSHKGPVTLAIVLPSVR